MAIDPRIPMMGEATPFESPFETQRNALALRQAQTQMQEAGEDRMLQMLRKGREVLASSYDEPSYQRGLQTLQRLGIPTNDMPPTFDPRYVENESRALLTAEQQHRQQLFQHEGDVFGVNPFTGQVNELRRGVQAPPPAPKPIEPRLSELVDPKNPMRSLRVDLNTYQGGSLGDPGVYGVSSIREPKTTPVAKTPTSRATAATPNITDSAAAQAFLDVLVIDPTTKEDDISANIKKSTGGMLQKGGAAIAEGLNFTTEGQEAIGVLKSRASELVQGLLGGKLGAGISNADREFMMQRIGDIGNDSVSTGKRLAAWKSVVDLMKRRAAGNQTPVGGAGAGAGSSAVPEGVAPELWAEMTPEQRKLWQK